MGAQHSRGPCCAPPEIPEKPATIVKVVVVVPNQEIAEKVEVKSAEGDKYANVPLLSREEQQQELQELALDLGIN